MSGYRIKYELYTLRFKERNKENFFRLDQLPGVRLDKLFTEFYTEFATEISADDTEGKYLKAFDKLLLDQDYIAGTVEYGLYGMKRPVVNTETGEQKSPIEKKDAPLMHLHFLLYTPPGETVGIWVFQKYGNEGVKSEVCNRFGRKVAQHDFDGQKIICQVSGLVSKEHAIEFFKQSNPKGIVFRKYIQNGDTFSHLGVGSFANKPIEIEFKIKGNLIFTRDLEDHLKKEDVKLVDMPHVEGMTDAEIYAEVTSGRKKRLVNIETFDNFKLEFDVHEDVAKDSDNILSFESFVPHALSIAKEQYRPLLAK